MRGTLESGAKKEVNDWELPHMISLFERLERIQPSMGEGDGRIWEGDISGNLRSIML